MSDPLDQGEQVDVEAKIRFGDAKRYAEDWLAEVHSYEKDVVAAALLNLLVEREDLRERVRLLERREQGLREFVETWEALQLAYRDGRDEDVYTLSDGLDRQRKALAAGQAGEPGDG